MPRVLRGKCVIVGDSTVGKSSLAQAFHSDGQTFPKNYTMTTGVELLVKTVTIPEVNDTVEMFIYDCAGKECFTDTVLKHIDHPNMIMIVFDMTSDTSFSSCEKWLQRIKCIKPDLQIPAILVGNKSDLDKRRKVSSKQAEQFAMSNGISFIESSAKEMDKVDAPFQTLAKEYHTLYMERLDQFKELA